MTDTKKQIEGLLGKAETLAIDIHQRECRTEPHRDRTIEDASEVVQLIKDAKALMQDAPKGAGDFLGETTGVTNCCPVCEARQGWVPVSERLPEPRRAVWFTAKGYASLFGFRDAGGWTCNNWVFSDSEVESWQYAAIPEPPGGPQ